MAARKAIQAAGHLSQLGPGGAEQTQGIGGLQGLQFDAAAHQGAVVVQGAAQAQLQVQPLAAPPAGGQGPTAGRVEQVALVNAVAIDPQLGPIGPPAQAEPGQGHQLWAHQLWAPQPWR